MNEYDQLWHDDDVDGPDEEGHLESLYAEINAHNRRRDAQSQITSVLTMAFPVIIGAYLADMRWLLDYAPALIAGLATYNVSSWIALRYDVARAQAAHRRWHEENDPMTGGS